MFEQEVRKRKTRAFYDYDYKNMSEQGFKPNGWMSYQNSPYFKHKEYMESMGYEKEVEHDNGESKSRT